MKRDWKVIRQILLRCEEAEIEECDDFVIENVDPKIVTEHLRLCGEAGFLKNGSRTLSSYGRDWLDLIRNEFTLDCVLSRLDSVGIGHSSLLISELLKQAALTYVPQADDLEEKDQLQNGGKQKVRTQWDS